MLCRYVINTGIAKRDTVSAACYKPTIHRTTNKTGCNKLSQVTDGITLHSKPMWPVSVTAGNNR